MATTTRAVVAFHVNPLERWSNVCAMGHPQRGHPPPVEQVSMREAQRARDTQAKVSILGRVI
jgi:hypothetical protein